MGFDQTLLPRRANWRWPLAVLLLAGLAALAGHAITKPAPARTLVLLALLAAWPVTTLLLGWRQLRRAALADSLLPALSASVPPEPPAALARQNAAQLEAQLQHAPIALFQIDEAQASVSALNTRARRLLAPGRVNDVQALQQQLLAHSPGERGMIRFEGGQGSERALVASNALIIAGQAQRLVALMPVESELEAETLKAWRQLVHVLTHEIMNSLTPVASLSRTAHDLLDDVRPQLDELAGTAGDAAASDVAADLATALDAISRRAASLEKFVSSYRHLAALPVARPEVVDIAALFARVAALVTPAWQARDGSARFSLEPASLQVELDPGQLEQALINLLKNAGEATAAVAAPQVQVSARLTRGNRLRLEVQDNGPGVPPELVPHIFTPFFTTREKGGGIGLAMVRQLVHANGGTVRYVSPVQGGACFVLMF